MSAALSDVLASTDQVVASHVRPHAPAVDADGRFPREAVEGFREAGLLGLLHAGDGGEAASFGTAARVVERVAQGCGSASMVLTMHFAGGAVIEALGEDATRASLARGEALATLAFSEAGSRSHFWAPLGTAEADGDSIVLDAKKSWVTSARAAQLIVWSSQPLAAEGASTLWCVQNPTDGLEAQGRYTGLGLRGNDSTPMHAEGARVPREAMLGEDGEGFDIMMGTVLPLFNLCNAACSVGLTEAALAAATEHVSGTRYQHLDSALRDLPTIRAYLAKARIQADATRALWLDSIEAVDTGREDAMLRVLQVKAAANETAVSVTQECMRICGGAAYRSDVGVERQFRDARAGFVMAPTSDQLYDFIGKAVTGLPLF